MIEEQHPRQFTGVFIPAHIWERKDISGDQKLLWAEIQSLSRRKEGCTASNEFLAGRMGWTDRTLRNHLKALREFGLIRTTSFDGRHRTIQVVMDDTEFSSLPGNNFPGRKEENGQADRTEFSTLKPTSNIGESTSESTIESTPQPPNGGGVVSGPKKFLTEARVIIAYLNETVCRKFGETDANLRPIAARLQEVDGDMEGCKKMIDRMKKKWSGTKFEDYLCPDTLFRASKFQGYYANRDMPIIEDSSSNTPQHVNRNIGTANEGREGEYENFVRDSRYRAS